MAYVTRRQRKENRKKKMRKIFFGIIVLSALVVTMIMCFRHLLPGVRLKGENRFSIEIPEYSGEAYVQIGDKPLFETEDYKKGVFESYSPLDDLGRCQVAYANICKDSMPTEQRGEIGNVKPSGWKQAKYEGIVESNPPYLYNRCHLIAFCLAGENDNELNLITGTRYMNVSGMLPWEEKVAKYVEKTGNHVLYRVTPDFRCKELVARGVLIEAYSLEDDGNGICFCVYCYNVQPGVEIDYKSGESKKIRK